MKLRVTRTSLFGREQPCDEARPEKGGDGEVWWWIDMETIAELVDFCQKHGMVVFKIWSNGLPEIEIYDNYRE